MSSDPLFSTPGEENALYLELTDGIPGAIFQYILHPDGTDQLSYISRGCVDLWEIEAAELKRDPGPLWEMILPEDVEGLARSIRGSAETMTFWRHEWRIKPASGVVKWLSGTGTPKQRENGDICWNSVIIDVTRERQTQEALDSFFDQRMTMNAMVDFEGKFVRVNGLWETKLGYRRDELEGEVFIEFVHPEDREKTLSEAGRVIENSEGSSEFENRYRHKDGSYRWLSWSSVTSPEAGLIYAVAIDVTEARIADDKLRQAATVFQSTVEGVMISDLDNRIIEVNDAFSQITGYTEEEAIGKTPDLLDSGKHDPSFFNAIWQSVRENGHWRGEIWSRRKDGSVFPELVTISTILNKDEPVGYVTVFSDISTLKAHQEKLDYLAHHDPLTGLPNRLLFNSRLQQSIRLSERTGRSIAVLFIDIDRFKNINDSMGHPTGDELLKHVAARLREQLRASDTAARLGGDEFVVLLEDIEGAEHAGQVADTLMKAFKKTFAMDDVEIGVTVSMGISLFPQDSNDAAELLADADAAMYQAKENGRNTYAFYSSESTARALEYVFFENALRRAVSDNQLFLEYQPQFDLEPGKLTGMEALIRWQHPDKGLITPDRFIPIAEQNGTIRNIGQWVLQTACHQGKAWLDAGLDIGRISINVAASQFHDENFLAEVLAIVDESGLPPEHLELELTESSFMHQPERAIPKLHALRERNITIAIDDFGTGFSSLSYLKRLPIDKLKIDRSFVMDLPDDEEDKAIVRAIIGLGKTLKLKTIAEGVETEAQVAFFKQAKCDAQGFYFSRPLGTDAMDAFLRSPQTTTL